MFIKARLKDYEVYYLRKLAVRLERLNTFTAYAVANRIYRFLYDSSIEFLWL